MSATPIVPPIVNYRIPRSMVVHGGVFSIEIVDAYHRQKCPEHTDPASGETISQVDPRVGYYVRMQIVGGDDPDRVYLWYCNVNDSYIRHKQILSRNRGYLDVGLMSYTDGTLTGTSEPIQFQQATLMPKNTTSRSLIEEAAFYTDMVHMGKVTVKIYEGVKERHYSSFGNNCDGDEAYQPGTFVDQVIVHCCSTPEDGHVFLAIEDAEALKKALMKRTASGCSAPSAKKLRTENGFVLHQGNGATTGCMEY